jgi:curved DNA-binding protein CbpA
MSADTVDVMRTDPYAALGVDEDADAGEIRAAYLRLMREHHPDLRPDDPGSEDASRRFNAAYEILGDDAKRAAHDRARVPRQHRGSAVAARSRGPAYSPERGAFQRSFSAALLRVAAVVTAVGTILLLGVAPQ